MREESYALIVVSVFREPGFAVPRAEVQLSVEKIDASAGKRASKAQKGLTDARGEIGFRVPPVPGSYQVAVEMEGFESAAKAVTVNRDERADVYIMLKPKGGAKK